MDANLYSEGSIYYYENDSRTKRDYKDESTNHDFLVSRPVYVLKSQNLPFDTFTVNVLAITSSKSRVGIPININGYKDGKILPYAVHSIHKEYLTRYMGHANASIVSEVFDAVKYHMGYDDEIPNYIKNHELSVTKEKERLEKMTRKEKVLISFLKDRCLLNENYYSTFSELFRVYLKYAKDEAYVRAQTFSRMLGKHLEESVHIDSSGKERIFYGMSLDGDVHKISPVANKKDISNICVRVKKSSQHIPEVQLNDNDISDKSRKIYEKLDIIQKIRYYDSATHVFELLGIEQKDSWTVKEMVQTDINKKKNKVFTELQNGKSPMNFNSIDQYLLYQCSDKELKDNIAQKHLKNGGLNRIRRNLKQNIKQYL